MSRFTHVICERCWFDQKGKWVWNFELEGEVLVEIQRPVRLKDEAISDEEWQVERCCFCQGPTIFRCYVRQDPESVSCDGQHEGDDDE